MKDPKIKKQKFVDWDKVHLRMEAAKKALEKGWSPGEAEKKLILKSRAEALAREPEKERHGDQIEIVEFVLAYEKYGVESSYVREVYPLKEYTPVPCTPNFVLGIINVRGEILPVIDIRKFFDLPEKGLGDLNRVIILFSEDMEFGILADSIVGVSIVPVEGLQAVPPTFTGLRQEYLRGITGERTAVLDAGRILSDPRIIVNEFV